MADEEGLVHDTPDPVHDLIGSFCKVVFDIIEKDFVAIAWLHQVFSRIYFVEHDFGSTTTSCVSTCLIMSHVRGSCCYAGSILIASDSTLP